MSEVIEIASDRYACCRSCGAPIVWAITDDEQRKMPVDAAPVTDGNVRLSLVDGRLIAKVVGKDHESRNAPIPTYRSHFSTCADAGRWRKRYAKASWDARR